MRRTVPGTPTRLRHMRSRSVVGEIIRRLWRGEFVIVNATIIDGSVQCPPYGAVISSTFGSSPQPEVSGMGADR